MTFSRFIGILALISTALSGGATMLDYINPKYGAIALIISAAIASFTERIGGGLSTAINPNPKPTQ
jgi:Flp pilus assembly pilin Flp